MKYLYSFIFLLVLYSCSSTQKTTKMIKPEKISVVKGCPDKAECEVEILQNKAIHKTTEETTGKFYPEFKEDSTKTVVKVEMTLNPDKAAVDGQYREEIIFEWPDKSTVNLKGKELENLNLIFGRFCFCDKEQVGYFEIEQGEINIAENIFSLNFENSQDIPQILKEISGEYKLK